MDEKVDEKKWMTTKEVSEYLRISESQVFNLTSARTLPFYKLGRRNRYLKNEIDEYLLENERR